MIRHKKDTIQIYTKLDIISDPLHELIHNGSRQNLIVTAIEADLESILI